MEEIIKIYLKDLLCDVDWIQLAQDRFVQRNLVNTVIKIRIP